MYVRPYESPQMTAQSLTISATVREKVTSLDTSRNEILQIVGHIRPRLVRFARRFVAHGEFGMDAEDLVHMALESFCRAVRKGRYDSVDDATAVWRCVATIVRNKAFDSYRRDRTRKRRCGCPLPADQLDFLPTKAEADPAQLASNREQLDVFQERLRPSLQKLLQYKIEGYKTAELAKVLAVSDRTVQRWLQEIRKSYLKHLRVNAVN